MIRTGNLFTFISAPNAVPQNVKAEATGSTTIKVSWDEVNVTDNIGFQGYRIKYEVVDKPRLNGSVPVNKNTLEKELTNLTEFTDYKIQVAARTTHEGNYSNPRFAKTKEGGKYMFILFSLFLSLILTNKLNFNRSANCSISKLAHAGCLAMERSRVFCIQRNAIHKNLFNNNSPKAK